MSPPLNDLSRGWPPARKAWPTLNILANAPAVVQVGDHIVLWVTLKKIKNKKKDPAEFSIGSAVLKLKA
jgi:hypothetical protein